MLIKICGLTNYEDAHLAREYGADLLGFIFFKKSPRYIESGSAKEIISKMKNEIVNKLPKCVGVFVNADLSQIVKIAKECRLDAVQLHGDESSEFCLNIRKNLDIKIIKVTKIKNRSSLQQFDTFKDIVDCFLCDTYSEDVEGGTGKVFNHNLIKDYISKYKIFLSGGLTPDNILNILNSIKPYGVDISSGIEASAGKKDALKLKNFIKIVRENE